jgi:hypothetical protein
MKNIFSWMLLSIHIVLCPKICKISMIGKTCYSETEKTDQEKKKYIPLCNAFSSWTVKTMHITSFGPGTMDTKIPIPPLLT